VQALEHLNLLDRNMPSHAAMLLFGKAPQRFMISSEVKCMHFHGTEVRKPIPSYQIYKGTVFDLVDQALDFVMSKVARSVGTRDKGPQAPVEYELPKMAVAEAIVNAIAHRDYSSNASVQVMLFSDRLEVWNPGHLPPTLTPEKLRHPHPSIPRNPLIADPLFLAHYIEKAGSGTLDMIGLCREAKLPEPEFRQDGGQWVVTLRRPTGQVTQQVTPQDTGQIDTKLALSRHQVEIMHKCQSDKKLVDLMSVIGRSDRTKFRHQVLKTLLDSGLLEMTIPDKPTSRLQKYRLSEKGRNWLEGASK
jgi:ATP-dependent DNA helicase RecG